VQNYFDDDDCDAAYIVSWRYSWCAWLIETAAYCAVDAFALISGYFFENTGRHLFVRSALLWLQTVFYTVIITGIAFAIYPESRCITNVIYALFPLFTGRYWYFTAYIGMMFFVPLLNVGLMYLDRKQEIICCICILFVVCIVPIFTPGGSDILNVAGGGSFLWLSVMYYMGGMFKKYKTFEKRSSGIWFMIYVCAVLSTFIIRSALISFSTLYLGYTIEGSALLLNTSPTVLVAAIGLVGTCSRLSIKEDSQVGRLIRFAAPASFGVYLIHDNPIVRDCVLSDLGDIYLKYNPVIEGTMVVIGAIMVYTVCCLVDRVRMKLFEKLNLRIWLERAELKLTKKIKMV